MAYMVKKHLGKMLLFWGPFPNTKVAYEVINLVGCNAIVHCQPTELPLPICLMGNPLHEDFDKMSLS